jgi:hypothetical protein
LVGLIGVVIAATTFVWQDPDPAWPEAEFVASGQFEITATSDPVWREASATMATAPRVIDPETFQIHSGDSVQVDYPFEMTLPRESTTGTLRVEWMADTGTPDTVIGLYSIHDDQGHDLTGAMTTLGSEMQVEFPRPDDGVTGSYVVRIYLDFAGLDDRFGSSSVDQLTDLGDFTVELR